MDIIQTFVRMGCIGSTFRQPPLGVGQSSNSPGTDTRDYTFCSAFSVTFISDGWETCRLWLYFQWFHWGTGCACHQGRRSYDVDTFENFRGLFCFPLDMKLQKGSKNKQTNKKNQHWPRFVKIWKQYGLWSVLLPSEDGTIVKQESTMDLLQW